MQKINVLFPIEVLTREIDFRLFLACLSARENTRIWIGQSRIIYGLATGVRGGLYVGKNLFGLPPNITWHRYRNLKQRDFRIVHLDEEGAIFRGGPEDWKHELKRRFDPTQLAAEDYLCTWGDFQRDYYRSFDPPCLKNVRTTGHPRFDMYKPKLRPYFEPEAARLRARYGDFILINSNLHRVNHHEGVPRVFSERLGYYPEDAEKRAQFFDRWQHLTATHAAFVHLINSLSLAFPDQSVVIRPHPSENQEFYESAFGAVKNVHVSREGSVGPWLAACRAMIHDGCTTGLEAHLAQVPVINFKPLADAAHDSFLPNLFGARCRTDDEVIGCIEGILKGDAPPTDHRDLPDEAYALIDNFRHDSFAQLTGVIDEIVASMPPEKSSHSMTTYLVKEKARRAALSVKKRWRADVGSPLALSKFRGFEGAAVEEKLALIQQLTGTRVRHTVYSDDLMSVETA